jgi:hypothetical protein
MMMNVLAAALAASLMQAPNDTTFAVGATGRVDVETFSGAIVVRSWDRSAVRVRALGNGAALNIRTTGSVVYVRPQSRGPAPSRAGLEIHVPAAWGVAASSPMGGIVIDGAGGEVTASTAQGSIEISRAGRVRAESANGSVQVSDARGPVTARTANGSVRIDGADGDVLAETVNGPVTLTRIRSASVEASSMNGQVSYTGSILDGGRYHFSTHNGAVRMAVPEQANATVSIYTHSGRFDAGFPITLTFGGGRTNRSEFVLGSGSARIELESFSGDIRLIRP